ncbi:DUF262 domain-containing protein [Apilactobacillus micheneri]|uniref:DUF262 domain-containing protein n=1 Tax=Apilactobacillus micheneri TaxID=1899430 RepID=UPI0011264370|nr:DUF262 domain-containing protein [Apilactobacillus micheneri]TPR42308.1 DUF262 domain-containing protein [Apilactobacillus micheneri]TPR47037.1 DUF262 domain-containing protein [Apilactobacillus micheneri]
MNFDFKTNSTTIKGLFKKYGQFQIPVFQRAYTWEPYYYKIFLNDIVNSIDSEDNRENNYFLGTMVFNGDENDNKISVVDGQQRLTVITIIFSAISKRLKEINEDQLSKATFRYVQDENDNGDLINHLKSDNSFPFIESFIQSLNNSRASEPNTEEELLLKKTYEYFFNTFSMEKITKDRDQYVKELINIRNQILNSRVIEILTYNKSNAYKIFEILNAKGKSLASIDLIKNIIFESFYNNKNNYESVAKGYWSDIQKNLRDRNQNIGLATFYRQYWLSKYNKVPKSKLYDAFKKEFKDSKNIDKKYIKFLKNLVAESKQFIQILSPSMNDYQNRNQYLPVVQKLKTLNNTLPNTQYTVIVLSLMYAKRNDLINLSDLIKALTFIEDFIFMYTSMGKGQANIYESRFSKIAISLRGSKSKHEAKNILEEQLYNGFNDRIIDYKTFESNFIKLSYTKKSRKENLLSKYVARRISNFYDSKNYYLPNSSIEHIIPESTNNDEIENIGNIILIEKEINDKCKDKEYIEKKKEYEKSNYEQVKNFVKDYKNFNNEEIKERAKKLSLIFYNKIIKNK